MRDRLPSASMQLDLRALKRMHPRLPATTAAEFANRGALALQRRDHVPGCPLEVTFQGVASPGLVAFLDWVTVPLITSTQFDRHRVTEDGAEAVALALVSASRSWSIRRRLQRGESGDCLMEDPQDRMVVLEVSGIDGPLDHQRLEEKLRQVSKSTVAPHRSACVVAFTPPAASLATA